MISKFIEPPVSGLSLAERDYRWVRTRALMSELGLGILLVGGFRSRDQYEHYLSNDYLEGAVIFSLTEEPVALSWTDTRIFRAEQSYARGDVRWINDYRVGLDGFGVAALLKELSASHQIGVIGLDTLTAGELTGFIPARFWLDLVENLPGRELVDVSWPFNELMLAKSEEELNLLRWAAEAAEAAAAAMYDAIEPGVPETEVYAEILSAIFRHGCHVHYPSLILHSGPENLSWGPPRWTTTVERAHRIAPGELVQAEIFPTFGNTEVQVQMSVSLGKPNPTVARLAGVSRASYEAGLSVLKAGVTFGELVAAMEQPLRENGCWAQTPLVHSLNPIAYIGSVFLNRDQAPKLPTLPRSQNPGPTPWVGTDVALPAGTTLAFEPNAALGRTRVVTGGTVVVTETGYEELNSLPCHMRVKE